MPVLFCMICSLAACVETAISDSSNKRIMWLFQSFVYLGVIASLLDWPCAQGQVEDWDTCGKIKSVRCKSYKNAYKECFTNETASIIDIRIKFFAPNSAECEPYEQPPPTDYAKDQPGIYGYDAYRVWVQNNCRATFEVCIADECGLGTGINCHADAKCELREDGIPECRCKNGLYGDGITSCSKRCKCSATGDPHYKTFDGQMIHYQGVCTYTLVDARGLDCGLRVNVKNKRSSRNSKVALANKVTVTVWADVSFDEMTADEIVIDQGRKVTINGIKYSGGVSRDSFDVIFKGSNVIVKNRCGMEAMFNGDNTVKVFVPQEFLGVRSGICGDCNGVEDDYKMKDETDVSSSENKYSLIGQSYYFPLPEDDIAECTKDDKDVVCTKEVNQLIATNDFCGKLLDKAGPFKDCIAALGDKYVKGEYDGCEFDVCANWGSDSDVEDQVCSAMAKLNSDCLDQGITNINYRTADFCAAECGPNMVYDPAMSIEIPSCKNPSPSQVASEPVVEGCKCQEGFLLDDGKDECVRAEECGCPLDDNYYSVGEGFLSEDCLTKRECVNEGGASFLKDAAAGCGTNEVCRPVAGIGVCECAEDHIRVNGICEERCNGVICHENAVCIRGEGVAQCRCNKGLYGNGVTGCSERCKCSATGDPHYRTFDGQMIHFQGHCTYTLVDTGSSECGVNVLVKNIRSTKNPKVSLTNKVTVIVKSAAGDDTIVIDQGRSVSINGVHYTGGVKKKNFEVLQKGDNIIVENNCDMIVQFNGETTAKVLIPKHHAEVASGICGKCNGLQDDYRQKDGTDVSGEVNKYSLIGHSYWVPQTGETETTDCLLDDEQVTCTDEQKQQIASNDLCGKIKDSTGPFGECINSLDAQYVEDIYKECEFDVCANWGSDPDVTEQVCNAMAKFQGDCNEEPIGYINYRTADFCPASCGSNMVYDPAINSVQPSCKQPNPPQISSGGAAEGCKCKEGYLLDEGGNRCVREEDCGCAVEDNYYPIGYDHLNEQCTVRTSCLLEDGLRVYKSEASSCGVDEFCNVTSPGIGQCVCIDDYIRVNGICKASADCTGTQVKVRCKSYKNEYLECPTGKTSAITKIWIKFLAAHSEECNYVAGSPPADYPTDKPGIYGFGDDFVWVLNNCRATFYVCLAD